MKHRTTVENALELCPDIGIILVEDEHSNGRGEHEEVCSQIADGNVPDSEGIVVLL